MKFKNAVTGKEVDIPMIGESHLTPTFIESSDTLLRQHCLELAISRHSTDEARKNFAGESDPELAQKYYDFIKGEDKKPGPPSDEAHCTHDPKAIPRPNSFEANVELGKTTFTPQQVERIVEKTFYLASLHFKGTQIEFLKCLFIRPGPDSEPSGYNEFSLINPAKKNDAVLFYA